MAGFAWVRVSRLAGRAGVRRRGRVGAELICVKPMGVHKDGGGRVVEGARGRGCVKGAV